MFRIAPGRGALVGGATRVTLARIRNFFRSPAAKMRENFAREVHLANSRSASSRPARSSFMKDPVTSRRELSLM